MEFLKKIKDEIRPSEDCHEKINKFIDLINEKLSRSKIKATCVKGGSTAKGTFLKGDFDVDLFVKFDYSYKNKDISKILEKSIKGLKHDKVHGSRDYFQIKRKYVYEIVPVLDITDPNLAMNVTDMSPLHVAWVLKNLKKGQADEIRLTKLFCKAQKVYGAESYIGGFSGHVLDILIIHYGSFLKLLNESANWKPKVIIGNDSKIRNSSKTFGPIIIVDPILPNRNAAAALTLDKFNKFRDVASKFLKNPSEDYFIKKTITLSSIRKSHKNKRQIIIRAEIEDAKKDIMGAKFVKAYETYLRNFNENDFSIVESDYDFDSRLMWFIFDTKLLDGTKDILGPKLNLKDHCEKFRKKYKSVGIRNNRLIAKINRKFVDPRVLADTFSSIQLPKIKSIETFI